MSGQTADPLANILTSIRYELKNADMLGSYAERTIDFFNAVDWTQPWLISVMAFHIVCFLVTLGLRNKHDALSVYFFVLLGLAALTQPLNHLGIKHWKSFANEPYFDASGIFIVSVYSFPLIFNGFVTLIFILKATISALINTKRAQLKQKIKSSKQQQKRQKTESKKIK
ncbi:AA_permease domain-containing protein [Mucor velutinosus]|uniref:AA_permease domain-containing protein n=1 Tax=Mucor velutinosus TaxID=708070 RepID=A0AAN7HWP0_9FUNG|nr:AA_permease domain-containing protein [Mucor velutinosus]